LEALHLNLGWYWLFYVIFSLFSSESQWEFQNIPQHTFIHFISTFYIYILCCPVIYKISLLHMINSSFSKLICARPRNSLATVTLLIHYFCVYFTSHFQGESRR
jgi:hypothetical protein